MSYNTLDQEVFEEDQVPSDVGVGEDKPEARMGIFDHLEELRSRLIRVLIVLAIFTFISFFLADWIFVVLKSRVAGLQLIRTNVAEMVGTYMKVCLMSGVALTMPVAAYQLVMFIAPALKPQEKRLVYIMLPGVFASFLLGAAFAFFVLLPPALGFLIHFGEDIALPLIRVGDYVSVVVTLTFWIGLAFETPVVIFFLTRIGLITPLQLTRFRRLAFVAAFVLAAIITPTVDPLNQIIVAVPLMILYEIGILLSRLAFKQRNQAIETATIGPVER